MFIAAVACIVVGGVLLWFRARSQNQLLDVQSTEISPAGTLQELARSVAAEIGAGGFQRFVSVAGRAESTSPLTSELGQKECVYYTMSVEERYEETYTETDSNGRSVQKTRTSSTTVASNTRSIPFDVRDDSGAITVDPEHAKVECVKVVDKYEPSQGGLMSLSFGGFSLNLAGSGGRRILGYHYTESIIPMSERLYVIGEANDRSGSIVIGKPQEKGKPFLVKCGTRDEVVRSKKTTILTLLVIACVLFAAGVILAVMGAVR
jgi:hypothetical protein